MIKRKFFLLTYLLLLILLGSSLVLSIVQTSNRRMLTHTLFEEQREKFDLLTKGAIGRIDLRLKNVEEEIEQNIQILQNDPDRSKQRIETIMTQTIKTHSAIFGSLFIYTKEEYNRSKKDFCEIYVWRDGTGTKTLFERESLAQDYASEWYTEPFKRRAAVWSRPYFDKDVDVLMITYSAPVINKDGSIEGIFTADVTLDWLVSFLKSQQVGETGRPVLILGSNTIVFDSQETSLNADAHGNLISSPVSSSFQPTREELLKNIQQSLSGSFRFERPDLNDCAWLYFNRLERLGWTIGFILSESEVLGIVNRMNNRSLLFGALGILILIPLSFFIAQSVARPLSKLCTATREIAEGNFDAPLPRNVRQREIDELVTSFDKMRTDLRSYIQELTEQERMKAQLNIASKIQLGMVPKNFESVRNNGFDLYALMEPAQEVGGDLYDFDVYDGRLFFCIGDVSGKGIPASLFMTAGKTLIRSAIGFQQDPAEVFTFVNKELSRSNEGMLFITALCGLYDRNSGDIVISCAGHCLPIVIDANGNTKIIKLKPNLPLAIFDDFQYINESFHLEPGSTLLIYTDGATDAVNRNDDFFTEKNLVDAAGKIKTDSMEVYVRALAETIHKFANGAKQSDDITILAFKNIESNQI